MRLRHPTDGPAPIYASSDTRSSAAVPGAELGALPEWQLADLYASPSAPEIIRDFAAAAEDARRLKATYQGKLAEVAKDPPALADAVAAYERLSDLMGRLGSYVGLLYAADQSDPVRAKFYGDTNERLTNISADLIFL